MVSKTKSKTKPVKPIESQLKARVARYEKITREAMDKISISARKGSKEFRIAEDFLSMTRNYFADAKHFAAQEDFILALAAFSYAHAWMDAGVRAGILDGKQDDRLFTLR